ncbi:LacI family DNA-binding transcriptional regulator [Herpetosiphon giganteus]|uniref:LacI family DNA-binding transcriptional regulator n=1 Tax=Herpetosiphon giganteus TaxID=2029754 RepID=UPI00195B7F18|nr:LacI family DNA-binding transcriptional regulator [Herpetosiphon giganteus]MBM7845732.1 DNA-binding LacI/PurR family transcriptional regulator [Herpetosiphon giganteus]
MAYTIKDVAKRAGVGIATVSRVLNESPNVLPETRARVLAVIDELGYRPNHAARQLVTAKTNAIAIILPFLTRPFFIEVLRGIESVVANSEYQLIIFNVDSPEQRTRYFNTLPFLGRTDGLLIVSLPLAPPEIKRLQAANLPAVMIDTQAGNLPSVVVDNVGGAFKAVEHLISKGHQRIGFVSGQLEPDLGFTVNRDRQRGYEAALTAHHLPVQAKYLRAGFDRRDWGHQAALELLDLAEPPSAIFAANDDLAFGIIDALRERGLKAGDDLAVVGYDDLEMAQLIGLTTIHQPMEQMGRKGAEVLLAALNEGTRRPTLHTLPVNLIERASSVKPSKA